MMYVLEKETNSNLPYYLVKKRIIKKFYYKDTFLMKNWLDFSKNDNLNNFKNFLMKKTKKPILTQALKSW